MAQRKTVRFNDKIEVRYFNKGSIINEKLTERKLFRASNLIIISIVLIGLYHFLK